MQLINVIKTVDHLKKEELIKVLIVTVPKFPLHFSLIRKPDELGCFGSGMLSSAFKSSGCKKDMHQECKELGSSY